MPVDHIRYDILVQEALRGMVRDVLADAAKNGLPGEHHFFITFDTTRRRRDDCRRGCAQQYPEEMTIVLQHQFWDLKVTDEAFEVGLSFGGVAGTAGRAVRRDQGVRRPVGAVHAAIRDARRDAGRRRRRRPKPKRRAKPSPSRATPADAAAPGQHGPAHQRAREPAAAPQAPNGAPTRCRRRPAADKSGGAEVVRLDRFRKK